MKKRIVAFACAIVLTGLISYTINGQDQNPKYVDTMVLNGRATNLPKPEYRDEWKNANIMGAVYVSVTIDEQGNVVAADAVDPREIIISSGRQTASAIPYEMPHPLLQQSAIEAAKKATFKPTYKDGVPVHAKGVIVYNFSPIKIVGSISGQISRAELDSLPIPPLPPPPPIYAGPVSAGVLNGRAISLPAPEYPAQARTAKVVGSVSVQITVDENGDVIAAQAVSGHPMLRQSAVNSAREAKFSPMLVNGEAKKVSGVLIYNFSSEPTVTLAGERPKQLSAGVLNGRATSLPAPEYPAEAKAAKVSGSVSVQVVIDEEGNVVAATAASGHPMLRQTAVNAARQAKFSPTMLEGTPVRVAGVIVYNFVL